MGYRRQLERSAAARRAGIRFVLETCEQRLLLSGDGITSYPTGENTGGDWPTVLVRAPDGDLWFKGTYGQIGKMTEDGQSTVYDYGTSGMTVGPDGNIWFGTNVMFSDVNYLAKVTPDGMVSQIKMPDGMSAYALATDRAGNIWFTEENPDVIGRYSVDGTFSQFTLPSGNHIFWRESMTADSNGDVWFTRSTGSGQSEGMIDRITPNGEVTEYPIAEGFVNFMGLTTGPDGNLWFTLEDANASGDGFAVGKLTPQGTVSLFPIDGLPGGITTGPDGAIWFTSRELGEVY